ncbi:MAG: hypothetical protein QOJ59_1830, partial [Thermomicrobiales bacterium]|nr:hypothetical protein [Thermomicrobiales bacterium]
QGEGAEGAGEESAELATPEPTETPASDQAITAPETTPTTTDSPEANPTPDATENPEPTASSTDAAPAEATATPDASASAEPELIEIDVRSSDHDVEPGESTRYRFRVTNTTDHPVSLRLRTTDSAEGWTSTIYEADGTTELPARVKLDAGESINVIVLVVPPAEARPGDQNTTALDAVL